MNKLVSIIIPVYNVEEYILDCLRSIQAQTYSNFEVICINDGSTDSSGALLEAFCLKDPRFMCLTQKNSGPSIARNLAMKLARGDYYTFIDSDDTVSPLYLEVLVKGIEEHDCEMSICGHEIIRKYLIQRVHATKDVVISSQTCLRYLLEDKIIRNYVWGKCFKKELWNGIKFPEHKFYEDILTVYKPIMKAKNIYLDNNCLYHYMIREGSITQQLPEQRMKQMKSAYHQQMNDIAKHYPSLKIIGLKNMLLSSVMVALSKLTNHEKTPE